MSARREAWYVGAASLLLAAVMTWPTLAHPASRVPSDLVDPLAEAWVASWGGHALVHQPLRLFAGNVFYPLPDSYAFTDSLLGYAPAALVTGGPAGALVRYNLLYVFASALAAVGGYALARQLGSRPIGAAVAGAAVAYAPWRLAQAGHLNILSSGGIPLALALLARGHGYGRDGYRPERARPALAAAGWAVAAWQVSLGFALGLPFLYLLLLVSLAAGVGWLVAGRPAWPGRLLVADLAGGAMLTAVAGLLALPYLAVLRTHPDAARGAADAALYSPPPSGLLTAPEASWLWGAAQAGWRARLTWPPEMTLLPGFAVLALAAAGLAFGAAPRRRRLALAAVVVVGGLLALGTRFAGGRYGILVLQEHLPGWQSVRTTGRLILYPTLALGLLAGSATDRIQAALTRLGRAARTLGGPLPGLVAAVLPLLVLVEGVGTVPHPVAPPPPAAVRAATGPLLVLPSDQVHDPMVMWWSTAGFPPVVNGQSSVNPRRLDELRRAVAGFPDPAAVAALRGIGVRTVVLLPGYAAGTPWAGAQRRRPAPGVTVHRVGNDWLYTLPP